MRLLQLLRPRRVRRENRNSVSDVFVIDGADIDRNCKQTIFACDDYQRDTQAFIRSPLDLHMVSDLLS
jgi:hypothetical protein